METLATQDPSTIAKRLRDDSKRVDEDKPCSLLAYVLPAPSTSRALAIADHLAPVPGLSNPTKFLIYERLITKVKSHLERGLCSSLKDEHVEYSGEGSAQDALSTEQLLASIKVLDQLQKDGILQSDTTIGYAMSIIQQRIESESQSAPQPEDDPEIDMTPQSTWAKTLGTYYRHHQFDSSADKPSKRLCYICRLNIQTPHPLYQCFCTPCGVFNLAGSRFSAPPNLQLSSSFTALVTGARIHLGYATALRLLRCGARVIATSRYPADTVQRYQGEADFAEWKGRLKILGADFRSARDAFVLVRNARKVLDNWAAEEGYANGDARLSLLINNAAQTLTDSVKKEQRAIEREEHLNHESVHESDLLEGSTYTPRIRGGAGILSLEGIDRERIGFETADKATQVVNDTTRSGMGIETYTKSSWVQSLSEIPYEDIVSAHAVNTFVPLILCRELLPLMGSAESEADSTEERTSKPLGYIINVSSREGIFEKNPVSSKQGKHVHTNMSKAGLNMITETEASTAWRARHVAMSTVDPGYMSAAPEFEDAYGGVRPLGWEDGVGRVLWPVARGEREGEPVWGRFLKHYGVVNVDPGAGR